MDSECVVAALLHDAVEDTPLTFGEVETCFGPQVRSLVQGVTRVSKLDASKLQEIELELPMREIGLLASPGGTAASRCGVEMRISSSASGSSADVLSAADIVAAAGGGSGKGGAAAPEAADDILNLLHACAGDWRIAVLKVADRLHNMRTLNAMKPHKRASKAQETERVFVPLAHYLGAHDVGAELARLAALHREDDQPQHRVWAARLCSAVFVVPQERLSAAIKQYVGRERRPSARGSAKFARPRTTLSREPSTVTELDFQRLVHQLSHSEPQRAQNLYVRLRPLHERLSRHQAVMMACGWDGDDASA